MARKISFENTVDDKHADHELPSSRSNQSRPLLGMKHEVRTLGALGSMARSLSNLTEKANRADTIEEKLVQGQIVVDLDPAMIDGAFISDRMTGDDTEFITFRDRIEKSGQNSPILVRPHAKVQGRFEVAYGHRRLRAARELGRKVKAVVRTLSDEELIIAQGQENSSRSDLSYIERARFAVQLEERNFSRETIMTALNIDKAALSKLIAIATRIPITIIDAIGSAPGFGRQRWAELAEMLDSGAALARASIIIQDSAFSKLATDKRFLNLHEAMKSKETSRTKAEVWTARDGTRAAQIHKQGKKLTLIFDERLAPQFGAFVGDQLQKLYDEYRQQTKSKMD